MWKRWHLLPLPAWSPQQNQVPYLRFPCYSLRKLRFPPTNPCHMTPDRKSDGFCLYPFQMDAACLHLTCFSSPVPPLDLVPQDPCTRPISHLLKLWHLVVTSTQKNHSPLVFLFCWGHVSRERLLQEKKRNIFVADILSLSYGKCLCPWVRDVFIQHLYTASIHTTFTPTWLQWACQFTKKPSKMFSACIKTTKKGGKNINTHWQEIPESTRFKLKREGKNKSMHIHLWRWLLHFYQATFTFFFFF